jgi:class 3 adenylate cyclase
MESLLFVNDIRGSFSAQSTGDLEACDRASKRVYGRLIEKFRQLARIAAILVADVVGYSRLAGADEERTLARLRGLRSDFIDPTIAVHRGRVIKRAGDGSIIGGPSRPPVRLTGLLG